LQAEAAYDVILCNPPYVPLRDAETLAANVRDFEPHLALFAGEDGLDIIRRVVVGAVGRLSGSGRLMLEVGHDQAVGVSALLADAGWRDIAAYRDHGGHSRVLHARSGAAARTQVA
jgi:release factor glutamine methyltransferase